MLCKTLMVPILLLLSSLVDPTVLNRQVDKDQQLRAKVQIVQQKYCRADAELFTVSLKLKVQVSNPSSSAILVRTPLIPYIAKVSSSIVDAESGRILYE